MNRRTLRHITLHMLLALNDDATINTFRETFEADPKGQILFYQSLLEETDEEEPMVVGGSKIIVSDATKEQKAKDVSADNVAFVRDLLFGVAVRKAELDKLLDGFIHNYEVSRLDPTDHAILQIATFEMKHSNTPLSVVCSEAVHLSQKYGGKLSRRFVNGVLGSVGFFLRTDDLATQWQKFKFTKGKLEIEVLEDVDPEPDLAGEVQKVEGSLEMNKNANDTDATNVPANDPKTEHPIE